jgi:hypothetical protein
MADVGEAVRERNLVGPVLDGRALDLDRAAAVPADQVVVVAAGAAAVGRLTVVGAKLVDLAGVAERLQRPVHRGQSDPLTLVSQPVVQLLRGEELLGLVERGVDRGLLPRAADGGGARRPRRQLVPRGVHDDLTDLSCSRVRSARAVPLE